jgi:hypothetical protein
MVEAEPALTLMVITWNLFKKSNMYEIVVKKKQAF